eukprot:6175485-Pleurochrysis_carterae.AAC.2
MLTNDGYACEAKDATRRYGQARQNASMITMNANTSKQGWGKIREHRYLRARADTSEGMSDSSERLFE